MTFPVLYQDNSVYDGWCAKVYDDGRIEWRDAWFTNKLTPEYKKATEHKIREAMGFNISSDPSSEQEHIYG